MQPLLFVLLALFAADDKPKANARQAVESYVAATLAGKVEEAAAVAVEGQSPGRKKNIEEFKALVNLKELRILAVHACDKSGRATAVSEPFTLTKANPDGSDTGCVTFLINRVKDRWLVKDIDFRSKAAAQEQVKTFLKRYPEAMPVK